MNKLLKNNEYKKWLVELKSTIKQQQVKAALAVNSQLIMLYWGYGQADSGKTGKCQMGQRFY